MHVKVEILGCHMLSSTISRGVPSFLALSDVGAINIDKLIFTVCHTCLNASSNKENFRLSVTQSHGKHQEIEETNNEAVK